MADFNIDAFPSSNPARALKGKVTDTESKLANFSQEAGVRIGEVASDVVHTTADYIESGRSYVKENPAKAVAAAAGAGLLLGSLITMISRRKQ